MNLTNEAAPGGNSGGGKGEIPYLFTDDEGLRVWLLIGIIVIAGFAIVGFALYLMIPKMTSVTSSDMTAIVTAITTLVGTLIGTLVGYQSGAAQGRLQLAAEKRKLNAAYQEINPDCQDVFREVYFRR
jgi:hypothetical protein